MKKLTVTQWIAFISASIGIIMESGVLGDSLIVNEIVARILIIGGLVKVIYDLYLSYQAQDVANFANNAQIENNGDARRLQSSYTIRDVKEWAAKK